MFSKEPSHAAVKAAARADVVSQLAAPSVVSHLIPASYDGQVGGTARELAAVLESR